MSTTTDTTPRTIRVEHTEDGRWLVHVGNDHVSEYPSRAKARAAAAALRSTDTPTEEEVTGTLTPEENPTTDPVLMEMPYRELADLARGEHTEVRIARRAGRPLPPTPHLDALNLRDEAGERAATAKRTSKRTTSTRPEALTDEEVLVRVRALLADTPTMGKAAAWRAIYSPTERSASQERVAAAVELVRSEG